MRMLNGRLSNSCWSLTGARCEIQKLIRRARAFPRILASILAAAMLMSACSRAQSSGESKPAAPTQSTVMRTVTVTFDYDFSRFPACSAKITKKCIQQFKVYEVSANIPIFLFSIPVPTNAKGKVTGITGSAPQKHPFFTGPHRFGVSAIGLAPDGESNPYQCVTFAQVLPDNPLTPVSSQKSSPPK